MVEQADAELAELGGAAENGYSPVADAESENARLVEELSRSARRRPSRWQAICALALTIAGILAADTAWRGTLRRHASAAVREQLRAYQVGDDAAASQADRPAWGAAPADLAAYPADAGASSDAASQVAAAQASQEGMASPTAASGASGSYYGAGAGGAGYAGDTSAASSQSAYGGQQQEAAYSGGVGAGYSDSAYGGQAVSGYGPQGGGQSYGYGTQPDANAADDQASASTAHLSRYPDQDTTTSHHLGWYDYLDSTTPPASGGAGGYAPDSYAAGGYGQQQATAASAQASASSGYAGTATGGYGAVTTPGYGSFMGAPVAASDSWVGTTTVSTPSSLYCFALMMPHGYEPKLMRMLLDRGVSIFACDQYSVYSDGHVELAPGVVSEDIGSTKCDYGGPFHLALNSGVFVKVWRRVIADEFFVMHGWTVKVDPDSVFLPSRLREQVFDSNPDENIYLNNCDQGLHGPIEVIARGGMITFGDGIELCVKELKHEFQKGGEDVFLRHCLGILKVNRVDNFHLLSEKNCMWENPPVNGCISGKVSFHPFKTEDSYIKCLDQAAEHPPKTNRTAAIQMHKAAE